jgi:hypothetical protein
LQQIAKIAHIKIQIYLQLPIGLLQIEIAITGLMCDCAASNYRQHQTEQGSAQNRCIKRAVEILNALAHKAAKAAAIKLTQKDSKQFNHGEMINGGLRHQ